MEAALRVEGGAVRGGEDDATGADGSGDAAGGEDAHADGACALVSGAGCDRGSGFEAGGGGAGGADAGADFRAFEEAREPIDWDACDLGDFGAPAAVDDVEEQGSAGLLDVDRELAG